MLQSLENIFVAIGVLDPEFNESLDYKDYLPGRLSSLEDLCALVEVLFLHEVVDILEELFVQVFVFEEWNLVEEVKFELLPWVVVRHGLLLHLAEDIGEAVAEVVEYRFIDTRQSAVVRALDRCRPRILGQQRDFSEVLPLEQLADVPGVLEVVFDPDFAVSFCNEEQLLANLALLDNSVFWQM